MTLITRTDRPWPDIIAELDRQARTLEADVEFSIIVITDIENAPNPDGLRALVAFLDRWGLDMDMDIGTLWDAPTDPATLHRTSSLVFTFTKASLPNKDI